MDTLKPTDHRAALFTAACNFMNEAMRQHGDELARRKLSGKSRIDVCVLDLAGDRPRLELVVRGDGEEVVVRVHVDLERLDQPQGKPN